MDIESLMKKKEELELLKLDRKIPEVQFLLAKIKAPYMKLTGKSKVTGKYEEIIYIPQELMKESATLKGMVEDLGDAIPESNIPIDAYSSSTIAKVRDIIDKKLSLENFSLNELDELIEITNCATHLAFSKILQTLTNKIYSLCRPLSLKEIPEQLKKLNSDVFKPYIAQLFKNKIIKKSFTDQGRTTNLGLGDHTKVNIGIFSPNQKMIAMGYSEITGKINTYNGFCMYKINQDGTINKNQHPQIISQKNLLLI